MKMKKATISCAMAVLLTGGTAMATMESDTANYSLTLVDGCAIDSTAATTNFGTFPVDSAMLTGVSAGSIEVTCTTGTSYMVGMDDGLYGSGMNPMLREPVSWTFVNYVILVGGMPFGDFGMDMIDPSYVVANPIGDPISGVGTSTPSIYTLTADVDLDPMYMLPPGDYSDTVTFTVVW